jgi:hypothetical protein
MKILNRRYWVIFGSVGVVAIVAVIAVWVLMVSPQTLTICPVGMRIFADSAGD